MRIEEPYSRPTPPPPPPHRTIATTADPEPIQKKPGADTLPSTSLPLTSAPTLTPSSSQNSSEEWLLLRWFRCGVGFYNKEDFTKAIECFEKSVALDPLNVGSAEVVGMQDASAPYNAFQILARACIAVNRKDDAVAALKQSVMLDNPSDWQLLIELTSNKE
ncbi:uncharacterized protein EV422DRAFT_565155 [Fimicolochytrium jonesii]|uniref:uncharacterized protein n=1 Tax=Fimicolochytrium jonesii TaxID=1396493 RepID=UPI0022FE83D0|nr:uncharacterized protein EV422DRAFT_565155 [Fimicolochytrium jonesii]KAI8824466.1 hypothetical protein EV422DRAFT_565155 [Fimicolochytrium jonesii]